MKRSMFFALFLALPLMSFCQQWQWVKSEGGDRRGGAFRMNQGTAVCTDKSGNVYVIGFFSGIGVFGSDTIKNYIDINAVLIKYDSSGKLLWAKQVTRGATDFCHAICLDPAGNVCVTGDKSGSAIRAFTAKYTPDGKLIWENNATGEGCHSRTRAVVSDKQGNLYVAGDCSGVISFDTFKVGDSAKHTIFLIKYNDKGKVVWVRHSQPALNYYNQAKGLVIGSNGSLYMTGTFHGLGRFDNAPLVSKGASDIFLARYTTAGKMEWIKSFGGTDNDHVRSMTVDAKGALYITVNFTAPYTEKGSSIVGENLLKFNEKTLAWHLHIGKTEHDYQINSVVTASAAGDLYLTGCLYGTAYLFGDKVSLCRGASDIFVAKCSPEGKKIWKIDAGGAGVDEGIGICTDNNAGIYVTGYFHNTVQFGAFSISSTSGDDGIFVGKLK